MKKLIRVLSAGLGLALAWDAPRAQFPPPNVQLNFDGTSFLQNEEQIWINWTDPQNVVANWRDWRLGYRRVGFAVSTDGGLTWGTDSLVVGLHDRQSDPCLTGSRVGHFFFNMLDYESTSSVSQITVLRSTDGGATWTGPVATGSPGPYFEDKQFTTVDRTGGPYDGNYYVSWTRFPNSGPALIMFVRSTDGAQSFLPPIAVGPVVFSRCGTFSQGQGSIPVVNSDGTVHVFWSGYDIDSSCSKPLSQSYAIRRASSFNGGATFTADTVAFPSNAYFQAVDAGVDVYGFPIADADLSGGAYDGRMYIAHTQYTSGYFGETDVQLRYSTDNGITWSAPRIVNDDPPGMNIDQFHPWLAVNQQGVLVLVFYDQRTDPIGHTKFDCFFSASFDGGETFIHNLRLSEVSIDPGFLGFARPLAGRDAGATGLDPVVALDPQAGAIAEYIGVHANYDHVVAVWTDTRNFNQDVFATQFEMPFVRPRLYLPEDGTVTSDGSPHFRWSTCWHESFDAYRLELSRDPGFGTLDLVYAGISDNEFVPPAPIPTGDYFWRVKAFRSSGDSTAYSETFRLSPSCQPGAPPVLLVPAPAETIDFTSTGLTWSKIADAVHYDVQLSGTGDFSSLLVNSTVPDTGLTVSGLADTADYFWRVRTTNDCATGDWSVGTFRVELCPVVITGDVNLDGVITAADVIYLVGFVFKSGPAPKPIPAAGDVDCDGIVNTSDIIRSVNYIFKGGPPPCNVCAIL
jgi:hypothetical protein